MEEVRNIREATIEEGSSEEVPNRREICDEISCNRRNNNRMRAAVENDSPRDCG